MNNSYDQSYFQDAKDYILSKIDYKPELAIVLGSCLGNFADNIKNPTVIKYKDIPNFLLSTVDSHAGELILGDLCGKKVLCMSGRFHYYEGYDFEQLVIPVRLMKVLGIKNLILTNTAGGINPSYKPGDIMVIKDHIKLMGPSPVRGKNYEEFGPRFFDMSNAYDKNLIKLAREASKESKIEIKEGVYFYAAGPQFETPAEIKAMSILGADAVGMSTVTEVITAAHCGIKVFAMSMITNMAAGLVSEVTTEEVDQTSANNEEKFRNFLECLINKI